MSGRFRIITKRFLIGLNIGVVLVFLLACLAPYLNPARWWAISLLGLGFSVFIILVILFLFFWLFVKPRFALLSFVALLLGWKSISVCFALSGSAPFNSVAQQGSLRVATWNVARFLELRRNNNRGSQTRLKMLEQIKEQNADVVCLQEFFHSTDSALYDNITPLTKELGYPYHYYSWDGDGYQQYFGQAIFSRYPIVDSGIVHYPRPGMPESLIHADVLFGGDTVRFYTTHLQSVQFKKDDFRNIERIKNREDSILQASRNIFVKLKRAVIFRARQADIIKEITDLSPHPFVLAGDFNDVPNSYTYFTVMDKGLQDAFLKKGFGIGRTFSGLSPTLRIDYILPTKDFTVLQMARLVRPHSDHYMLVADIALNKK